MLVIYVTSSTKFIVTAEMIQQEEQKLELP